MVELKGMTIELRRRDEEVIYLPGDYEEAAFENTDNIDGNLPYLRVRTTDGFGHYYPLEYYEIKITGGKV